jgi:hypothetical protein
VQGGDAGLVELQGARTRWGAHGLVEVGLAERLARAYQWNEALPHFERAVSGHLLGLRSPQAVALAASEVAERAQRPDIALAFLEIAAQDLGQRERAQKRIAHVAAQMGDVARARTVIEELARTCEPDERPMLLAQLARVLFASSRAEDLADAPDVLGRAIEAAPEGSILHAQLSAELDAMIKRPSDAPGPEELPESDPVLLVAPSARSAPPAAPEPAPVAQAGQELSEDDPRAWLEEAREARSRGDEAAAERILIECLTTGLVEAGDELASMLEANPARTADLVRVRRLQVDFQPGHRGLLKSLRSAALADHNPTFARAVDHVLRAFDPSAGPLPPPPLGCQVEHSGMLQLLARPTGDPLGDVVMHIWESAAPLLARDLASYGVSGTDRVSPGAATTLSRLYEQATRLLGTSVQLYARRPPERASRTSSSIPAKGPPRGSVLLAQPLAALVTGEVRDDSPALRYALGYALAAALPRNALLLGMDDPEARIVWTAILAAFGPTETGRSLDAASSRLIEAFWTTVPPRAERRIKEVLIQADTAFAPVLERAKQTGRRVGLFLAGDFEAVTRIVAAELAVPEELLTAPSLEELCTRPVIADLLRLAVRPEYADARFQPMPESGKQRPSSSGRFAV